MDQRLQFVADHPRGLSLTAELCARSSVSRTTGDEWLARYAAEGAAGLRELIPPSPRRQEGSTCT